MGYHKNIDSKIVIIYISFNRYLLSTSYVSATELDKIFRWSEQRFLPSTEHA